MDHVLANASIPDRHFEDTPADNDARGIGRAFADSPRRGLASSTSVEPLRDHSSLILTLRGIYFRGPAVVRYAIGAPP
jgi:hypothetical protein